MRLVNDHVSSNLHNVSINSIIMEDRSDAQMKRDFSRRDFIKKGIKTFCSLAGFIIGSSFYAKNIEPFWLSITHHEILHPLIPKGFNGIKIVQFSDTHLGFHYQLNDLLKAVHVINDLQPDIVVFTGDLLDNPNQFTEQEQTIAILKEVKAPLGKYSVYGNHDHGGYGTENYARIMKESGFLLLKNSYRNIHYQNEQLTIAGIDDPMLGNPDWRQTLPQQRGNSFCLLLSHAPDLANKAQKLGVSLQLSGHSHGGQVKLPFFGPLMKPLFAHDYYEGMYDLAPLILYVNRGLGTTRLPVRLLSRPEISIFTLIK